MSADRAGRPMMARGFTSLAFALAATACIRTSQAPRDDVVSEVRGGEVSLLLGDGRERGGELLAVDDSSFVILDGLRVVVALRSAVGRIEWGLTRVELSANGLSAQDRETLTRRSRFPYGMSAAALDALLKDSAQREPETLRVKRP